MAKVSPIIQNPEQAKHWAKRYRTEIAASVSTLLSTAVSHPIDSIKTNMQAGAGHPFGQTVKEMWNIGHVRSFYKGPFELMKNIAQMSNEMAKKDPNRPFNTVGQHYEGKGTLSTAKEIIKTQGPLGLWTGVRMHMIRDTIGTGVYFMTYESMKQLIVKYQGAASPTSPTAVALAGAACGIFSWIATYHIDFVKNNYQRDCLETAKGHKVLVPRINYFDRTQLRGLTVTIFRSSITNAVLFSAFEYTKKKINNLPDPVFN
ncbi:hypothetical protein MMC13_004000 [Lambiella insularis]|nr:hypothetical protein [Lambiella insularis]